MQQDAVDDRRPLPGLEPPWYLRATPLAARPWLIRLRWARTVVDLAVLAAAAVAGHADFPLAHLVPFVAASAVGNAAVAVSLTGARPVPTAPLLGLLLLDVALLTGVLELTGGPFNPFAVIYAVHVGLAAVTLGSAPAALVGAAAGIGYGVLFYRHVQEATGGHHRLSDFPTHLYAMWIALASIAQLAGDVVGRASAAIETMRERAARADRVASLTTLAAGAAHELSTPLGTIAVVARELELATLRGEPSAALVDDARLIRTEVDRCRAILDQMSGRAGGIGGDLPERIRVDEAIADTVRQLPPDAAARVRLDTPGDLPPIAVSRAGFRQAILSLLTNAVDAGAPDAAILVSAAARRGSPGVSITVRDRGRGMPADVAARAGEPFFTTKDPGRGLGLGLFLARVFAERHGGALAIDSGDGTAVSIDLPAAEP
jgi:two-component system sensor histidine kinase RegB